MLERVAGAEIFCYVALITDVAREHSAEKNIIDKSLIFFFLWDKQFALFLNLSTYYQLKRERLEQVSLAVVKLVLELDPTK